MVEAMQPVIILGCDVLHRVRAGRQVSGLGPAGRPQPADVAGCRCDARTVGGRAGAGPDDQRRWCGAARSSWSACGRSWWATAGRAPAADGVSIRKGRFTEVFGSTPIRYLSPSEEFYAKAENFIGLTVTLRGPVDVGAMSEAFDTLMRVHPAHAGHLERGADGRHQIMVDDYEHRGDLAREDRRPARRAAAESVGGSGQSAAETWCGALRTHPLHPPCAGRRQPPVRLAGEAFQHGTPTSSPAPTSARPRPSPFRSRWRRSFPSVASSNFSGSASSASCRRSSPTSCPPRGETRDVSAPQSVRVPSANCRLSRQETQALVDICADRRVSLNALVAAAILMAEWTIRETPHLPIPYIYPVDLRFFLTPPVGCDRSHEPGRNGDVPGRDQRQDRHHGPGPRHRRGVPRLIWPKA